MLDFKGRLGTIIIITIMIITVTTTTTTTRKDRIQSEVSYPLHQNKVV